MARQISRVSSAYQTFGYFVPHGSHRKESMCADGTVIDVTPRPGCTYTCETWPPRGRGRGESLSSPRRCDAKLKAIRALRMRRAGYTWQTIAKKLGFKDASGPWRCANRAITRIEHERMRACH